MELAAAQGRILVTCDVADLPDLLRDRAENRRCHAGCIILVGVDHSEFGAILRTLGAVLAARPHAHDWLDLALFVGRRLP